MKRDCGLDLELTTIDAQNCNVSRPQLTRYIYFVILISFLLYYYNYCWLNFFVPLKSTSNITQNIKVLN
jgi:hypothetical protein